MQAVSKVRSQPIAPPAMGTSCALERIWDVPGAAHYELMSTTAPGHLESELGVSQFPSAAQNLSPCSDWKKKALIEINCSHFIMRRDCSTTGPWSSDYALDVWQQLQRDMSMSQLLKFCLRSFRISQKLRLHSCHLRLRRVSSVLCPLGTMRTGCINAWTCIKTILNNESGKMKTRIPKKWQFLQHSLESRSW